MSQEDNKTKQMQEKVYLKENSFALNMAKPTTNDRTQAILDAVGIRTKPTLTTLQTSTNNQTNSGQTNP